MEDRFSEIRSLIEAGEETQARDLLRIQIKREPSAEAYYLASKVAYNQEQRKLFLEHALELDPLHDGAAQALADMAPKAPPPPATMSSAPAYPFGELKPKRTESVQSASSGEVGGLKLADPGVRLLAYIIDAIILVLISLVIGAIVGVLVGIIGTIDSGSLTNISFILSLIITSVYYIYFLTNFNGQTPGKQMMKIRIVKKDGTPLTATDAVLRNVVGYILSGFVFWLGFLWVVFDSQHQGWHDKIINTIVVKAE